MKIVKTLVLTAVAMLCSVLSAAVSVTKGEKCAAPSFEGLPYTVSDNPEAIHIPNTGWRVVWTSCEAKPSSNDVHGCEIISTNAVVDGRTVPAIRLELTRGSYRGGCFPAIGLAFPVNFEEYNIWSFAAKIEVPGDLKPLIRDSRPVYGWFSTKFQSFFDDFMVSAHDGCTYTWTGVGVAATNFKNHDFPQTRGEDGFCEFRWDVPHEERTGYKGFIHDRVKELLFQYDTRKIPEGKKIVITIADMKLVKGVHANYDEPELYAEWLNFTKNYKADLSDSSEYLNPPKEGRLGWFKGIRIAKDGKALAEIVSDDTDALLLDNYFTKKEQWNNEIRLTRGREKVQARYAAYELQKWLKKLTGGDFVVLNEPSTNDNVKIFLGPRFAKDLPTFKEDMEFLALDDAPHSTSPAFRGGVDGFAVRVKDGNIYIYAPHPMGTANGVHAFLENNTDIIWAMADDDDGTVYTEHPNLKIVWGDAIEKPHFIIRGWMGGPKDWRFQNRVNFFFRDEDWGFMLSGGHYHSPIYYDHAEGMQRFSAVVNGKRVIPWSEGRALCCINSPDFYKHALETVPNVKEIRYIGDFNCIFGVDDNFNVCECELCQKPIVAENGEILTPEKDWQEFYCAWFYKYVNRVDDEIRKVWPEPGFLTGTFAYFFATEMPKIKVNKTVIPFLCTYYRKAYNQPIYAPANQNWWKIYRDWAAHTPNVYHYDYYGLGRGVNPYAEIYQRDLKAQRKIGFLRTATEGFFRCQYHGAGDERWVMTRLQWNTDLDVEQLHRYYNRRTYREAAPYIDKYRAIIRENWFKNFKGVIHKNGQLEVESMINELGLADELRECIDGALKAVKHETARRLVEKLKADFEHGISRERWNEGKWPYAGKRHVKPAPKGKVKKLNYADTCFTNQMAQVEKLAKLGDYVCATNALHKAMKNYLVTPSMRTDRFLNTLAIIVRESNKIDAAAAMGLVRMYLDNGFARANGWSLYMNRFGSLICHKLSQSFATRKSMDQVAKLYDIWINWDGKYCTVSQRTQRMNAKIDRLRQFRVDVTPYMYAYRTQLHVCAREGSKASFRGDAAYRLYLEDKGKMTVDQRIQKLFTFINDKHQPSHYRMRATLALIDACTVDGKTDWKRVSVETINALKAGDWSGLWRSAYARQNRNDMQLNTLLQITQKMVKAGEKEIAAKTIVDGATALGYTKDATKESVDKGGPAGFELRLKTLDDEMKKLGVSRR